MQHGTSEGCFSLTNVAPCLGAVSENEREHVSWISATTARTYPKAHVTVKPHFFP